MEPIASVEVPYLTELSHIASTDPQAVAFVDDVTTITYGEFIADVNLRAATLLDAGLRPADRVALAAENSAAFMASAFAVWSTGAVLATIYPSSASADLASTIQNADPVLLLADRHTNDAVNKAVAELRIPVAVIDGDEFTVPPVAASSIVTPTDLREPLALICYSSGTSSAPKAIMLSHVALFNGARTYADVWHLDARDTTIVCLPMAWMYALNSTTMATLLVGGTVIALRRARPDAVIEAITTHRATFLPAVTTVFTKLVQYLDSLTDMPDLSSLRLAVSAGEPRNERAFDHFTSMTGRGVLDSYCASEMYPLVTYDPTADPMPVLGSAGKLVPRSELRVVDQDGVEVAPGEIGEGLSRGAGLMLGYWRDPEQTRAALTVDGWYRTKDLLRVDSDGYVYVVGRASDMIIRGGSNVSPAEVAKVLRDHPAVRDAVVVGLPDEIYGEEVAAAVLPVRGASLTGSDLKAHASEHLASFKVPSKYVIVDDLPMNSTSGKVDRRRVIDLVHTGEGI